MLEIFQTIALEIYKFAMALQKELPISVTSMSQNFSNNSRTPYAAIFRQLKILEISPKILQDFPFGVPLVSPSYSLKKFNYYRNFLSYCRGVPLANPSEVSSKITPAILLVISQEILAGNSQMVPPSIHRGNLSSDSFKNSVYFLQECFQIFMLKLGQVSLGIPPEIL